MSVKSDANRALAVTLKVEACGPVRRDAKALIISVASGPLRQERAGVGSAISVEHAQALAYLFVTVPVGEQAEA